MPWRRAWRKCKVLLSRSDNYRCVLLLFLSLYWAPSAQADTFAEAKAAYLAKDYPKAFALLQPLARQGMPQAQAVLGILYEYGHGVPRNDTLAVDWYRKAAEAGLVSVQSDLGMRYFQGRGVTRDYRQASQWWDKAAGRGNAEAQYHLGMLYAQGLGVPQDDAHALRLFRQAAAHNQYQAEYATGVMYAFGRGTPADAKQAYTWFRKAADHGVAEASYNLALLYENGRGAPRDLKQAKYHYQQAAAKGVKVAEQKLAQLEKASPTTVALHKAPPTTTNTQVLPLNEMLSALNGVEWVAAQSAASFSFEFADLPGENSVLALMQLRDPEAEAGYFKLARQRNPVYIAVMGVYPSAERAQRALMQLPQTLRAARPKIRKFGDIQAQLQ